MTKTIYLTADEQKAFAKLAAKDWQVHAENVPEDTEDKMRLRMGLMRLHDKHLIQLQEQMQSVKNEQEFAKIASSFDLSKASQGDLAELYFAMGPVGLSAIIAGLLSDTNAASMAESIAAFTHIRHSLIESL